MSAGKGRGWLFRGGIFGAGITAVVASAFAILASVGVAASTVKPVNSSPPTISGTPQEGKTLTANRGTWDNNPTDYDYFWRRCGTTGSNCSNISGAHALTYTLQSVDVGNTLRFRVVAKNADGQTTADSAPTEVIQKAATTTTTTTTTPAPPAVNHRPTIRILSVRFAGARVYVRMRVCDDSRRRLNIIERDSKPGVRAYVRRFRTLAVPRPCAALTRTWIPAPRFRHGRFTIKLWARDFAGLTSSPAARTFVR